MAIRRGKRRWAVVAAIVVSLILLIIAVTHKSYKQAVNDVLSDFEKEYQNAIVEEYPREVPMDELWDNDRLHNKLDGIIIQYAEKLTALGEGAVEVISACASENAILYTHLSAWHHGHPGLESIREEILKQEYALKFLENPWHEIISGGRLFVCFTALEKIGKPASETLESMLPGEWTGFPAAITLANIREEDILRKHFKDSKATGIERLNSAIGLAFLKDKTVLSFLMRALSESKSPKFIEVETAIIWLGKEAVPQVRKAYEEGRIPRNAFMVLGLLRTAGVNYSKQLHVTRFSMEEDEALLSAQKPRGGLTFKADQIPEEQIADFFRETLNDLDTGIRVRVEVGTEVKYKYFEKFLTLCEKNGIYEISIKPLILGIPHFHSRLYIRLHNRAEEPALTLQMLAFRLEKKELDTNTAVATFKDTHFEFEIPGKDLRPTPWGKLYRFLGIARDNFRPTRSFKTLPVVVEPTPDLTMDAVIEFLMICQDANIADVNFAHHTRGCDWVNEVMKIEEQQREKNKEK
jgi:biopolymer transport protein ExbD